MPLVLLDAPELEELEDEELEEVVDEEEDPETDEPELPPLICPMVTTEARVK